LCIDHGGENGPPARPAVDAVAPAPAPVPPETPPHSPSPAAPPRLPSPIGIGARLPRHTRTKPREWWKLSNAQLDDEVDDDIEDADMGYEIACSTVSMAELLSYAEAMRCPDAEQWKQATLEELNAHSINGTWKLVPRPTGKKVIGSKWVFIQEWLTGMLSNIFFAILRVQDILTKALARPKVELFCEMLGLGRRRGS